MLGRLVTTGGIGMSKFKIGDILNFGGMKYELVVATSKNVQFGCVTIFIEKTNLYLRNLENSNTVCLDESEVIDHIRTWNKLV